MRKFKKRRLMSLVLLLILGCTIGVGVRYSILHTKKHNNSNNHMAIYVPNDNGEGFQLSNLQKIPEGYRLNVEETNAHCSDGLTASWDDTTKTVSINATKSGGCNLYLEKEPVARCIDTNGNDMTCPQTLEIGQRIAIGDEVFRFIRYTSTSSNLNECGGETGTSTACGDSTDGDIRAIAEYNLYVGDIYDSSWNKTGDIATSDAKYGKQDSTARGSVDGGGGIGVTAFSSDSVKGTNYSSYSGSIVGNYVEEYVQYLSDEYDATVSGSLITYAELTGIFSCSTSSYKCPTTSNGVDTSWIYTTTYWTGSPSHTEGVAVVHSNGGFYSSCYYGSALNYGVRPVITISASDI